MKIQKESKNNIKERIDFLRKKLISWNKEYYENSSPIVDDYIYDQHMLELIELEENNPEFIDDTSPTRNVGKSLSRMFEKTKHIFEPMLSLSNVFNETELMKFHERLLKVVDNDELEFVVEPKIDGVSISLHYKNGNLINAITRGDGIYGEIVTNNILTIPSIPKKIEIKKEIIVRGEIYMRISSFQKLNKKREENKMDLFSNPRNLTSGTIRHIDSSKIKDRELDFFAYSLISEELIINTQWETLMLLKENHFPINSFSKKVKKISDVISVINEINEIRKTIDYEIDGAVIKVDNKNIYNQIGITSKFPKWATAYKFKTEVKETKLIKIFPTVGRTGRITYNAKLEKVEILGTIVKAATLHNYEYIKKMDIRENDIVLIKKAGEIIPKVIGVNKEKRKNTRKFQIIRRCPICNSELEKLNNEVDQYCINSNCEGKQIEAIKHFTSREAMNIDGLSSRNIEKFINMNILKNIKDIYLLEKNKKLIMNEERYGEKSVNNIIESINKSKSNSLEKLLVGLGIRYIGKKTALEISKKFKNIDNLINSTYDDFLSKSNLGEIKSKSLFDWFSEKNNLRLINDLRKIGLNMIFNESESVDSIFKNKNIIITGTIFDAKRIEIKEIFLKYGAKIQTTPSSKTEYIVVGDKPSKRKISMATNAEIIKISKINDLNKYEK